MRYEKIILTVIYLFTLFLFLLGLFGLFGLMSVRAYADETSTGTELVTEEVTDVTTIEETEPPADETTLSDINHRLLFIIFGQFCLVGILIGQGFSFWKW